MVYDGVYGTVYDEYVVRFIKDIRYGTMWVPGGLLVAT